MYKTIEGKEHLCTSLACLEHFVHCRRILHWAIWQHAETTDLFFRLKKLCPHLSGSNLWNLIVLLPLICFNSFNFQLLKCTTYPDVVYTVATAAILIQTRGVQSVFSLEFFLVWLNLALALKTSKFCAHFKTLESCRSTILYYALWTIFP